MEKTPEKIIAVNAHTIQTRGALKILEQFLKAITELTDTNHRYIVFVNRGVEIEYIAPKAQKNIEIVELDYRFLGAKVWFCWLGMQRKLREMGIKNGVDCVVSLSNMCTKATGRDGKRATEFMYYHQPVPLYPRCWNPLKKQERPFFFYQNIFRWFVGWSIHKKVTIISQLKCISQRIQRVYKVPGSRIMELTPVVQLTRGVERQEVDRTSVNLLYPASNFPYKNHKILFEALGKITGKKITLYLTLKPEQLPQRVRNTELGANINIVYMGGVSNEVLYGLFAEVDALVFPSYIETFGLPMVEAGLLGVGVLAGDMDFSREVLGDYAGARFLPVGGAVEWAKAIEGLEKGVRYEAMAVNGGGWRGLFDRINTI